MRYEPRPLSLDDAAQRARIATYTGRDDESPRLRARAASVRTPRVISFAEPFEELNDTPDTDVNEDHAPDKRSPSTSSRLGSLLGLLKASGKSRWQHMSLLAKAIFTLALATIFLWGIVLLVLISRRPPQINIANGFQKIASDWSEAGALNQTAISRDVSQGIKPVPVHSHNDYLRKVPLFDALAVGCTGVEADVWLKDGDLLVGHTENTLNTNRTLRSLYLDPLSSILEHRNAGSSSAYGVSGIYASSPEATLTLLIDMKSDSAATWPVLLDQLEPLHQKGFLTVYNDSGIKPGPITVVGTGNTPFPYIQNITLGNTNSTLDIQDPTSRTIFFDAPLANLTADYNATNSFYASVALGNAVGKNSMGGLSKKQKRTVAAQAKLADSRGLKARYWATPSWPISARDRIWRDLAEQGVGMLNADDVVAASLWNWEWCHVLGVRFC